MCFKCDTTIEQGAEIRPAYQFKGMDRDGKPIYQRVRSRYRHHKCPKVTPNAPGRTPPPNVDPTTGEVLQAQSAPLPHQESLL